jgi:hypothetical protein
VRARRSNLTLDNTDLTLAGTGLTPKHQQSARFIGTDDPFHLLSKKLILGNLCGRGLSAPTALRYRTLDIYPSYL